jgi:hypothetical protein
MSLACRQNALERSSLVKPLERRKVRTGARVVNTPKRGARFDRGGVYKILQLVLGAMVVATDESMMMPW